MARDASRDFDDRLATAYNTAFSAGFVDGAIATLQQIRSGVDPLTVIAELRRRYGDRLVERALAERAADRPDDPG